jgi:hypothetical protein
MTASLYARFGACLARTIEKQRAPRGKIQRGFALLNKTARAAAQHPRIRGCSFAQRPSPSSMPRKAFALATARLAPLVQQCLERLCD